MRRYTILLYPEDGQFSVLVPALPGCTTRGDTADEALVNAREAIEGHVATLEDLGRYVPEEESPPLVATVEVPAPPATPDPATGAAASLGT